MVIVKKVAVGVAVVIGVALAGGGGFVWSQTSGFDSSMAKKYDIALRQVAPAQGPEAIARGQHIAESMGGCALSECHGKDLGGGTTIDMGPLAKLTGPNITGGGLGAAYSDAELVRLIEHGVKKSGTSVRFMPSFEHNWLPDEDLAALVAYIRSVPAVKKPNGPTEIGTLGKILDQQDAGVVLDVARHIDHTKIEKAPAPSPDAGYGKFVAKLCLGCHGEGYSGGPLPGAPPDLPIPTNITPHETGLKGWTYDDFTKLIEQGVRKNGEKVNEFMPIAALQGMNELERKALWAYLMSLEPTPFGNR